MWFVIKKKFIRKGQLVAGGRNPGTYEWRIDRKVETLDEVESEEYFVKCNVKA